MLTITINGEPRALPSEVSVAELMGRLGYDISRIAVEVNEEVVPRDQHPEHLLQSGDAVEIVTLVGGGSGQAPAVGHVSNVPVPPDKPLSIGKFSFQSRLITGT